MSRRDEYIPVAEEIPFDNDTNGFNSDNAQDAIEEVKSAASPGFVFSREVESTNGTFLKIAGGTKSNIVGIPVSGNLVAKKIIVGNLNAVTYDVKIWEHDGNMTNSNLLLTLTKNNGLSIQNFIVNQSLTSGRFIAVEVDNIIGTTKPKEVAVFIIAQGDITI